jgi:RNA polymerase sigma factor (sigma-70 family)
MSESPSIVYVVDDNAGMRRALRSLIHSAGLQAILFASPREFLEAQRPDLPGCLVLDVRFPGASGLDFQKELTQAGISIPIIFISAHADVPMSVQAMKAGAVEFLTKPFRDQAMLDAIHQAVERDRGRRQQDREVTALRELLRSLTPREREVLPLVVSGLLNKQIAAQIGISEAAVKVHRSQLIRKMGAGSVAELVRMAEKLGIPSKSV